MEFEKPIIRITLYGRENVVTTSDNEMTPATIMNIVKDSVNGLTLDEKSGTSLSNVIAVKY